MFPIPIVLARCRVLRISGKDIRLGRRRLRETYLRLRLGREGGVCSVAAEGKGSRRMGPGGEFFADAEFPFVDRVLQRARSFPILL